MRFYAELRDFLPDGASGHVTRQFDVPGSVKDLIESCGVPHTEVDLIIVEGESVGFDHLVRDGVQVSVFPVFESFDISPIVRVRAEPLREMRFVADVHLGRLARYLRLLGFDTVYDRDRGDAELAEISSKQRRIVLTRDVELLKRASVTHGYYVRSADPRTQVVEVTRRFHLDENLRPFTRCMVCNGLVSPVDKSEVEHRLPPLTREQVDDFSRCGDCGRVYWQGAHKSELERIVDSSRAEGARPR